MRSRSLDEHIHARVLLKCENFQRVGAFKFRGAYNAMSQLTPDERARGVITFSSGNHAQAVALVGRLLHVATTIVMPHDAPRVKRAATEAYGATIIDYDRSEASRETLVHDLIAAHGYTLVPPFDDLRIVAGQGTAALELFTDAPDVETLLVPCGGGGLLSGSALAARAGARVPRCRVIGVEPERADDAARSFRTGSLHRIENPDTIADGTRTPSLGPRWTFPLILAYVDDIVTVSEAAIAEAVRFAFHRMKIVVEPSGALGLAALLSGVLAPKGTVGVIVSGGNVDEGTMRALLAAP